MNIASIYCFRTNPEGKSQGGIVLPPSVLAPSIGTGVVSPKLPYPPPRPSLILTPCDNAGNDPSSGS